MPDKLMQWWVCLWHKNVMIKEIVENKYGLNIEKLFLTIRLFIPYYYLQSICIDYRIYEIF